MTPARISDARTTPDMANDGKTMVNTITVEYATVQPFSLGDKWLVVAGNSHFLLHDGLTGKYLRPLKASNANEWIGTRSQPRWSRTDPDSFYFITGNSLKLFNVVSMTSTLVRQFKEYATIDGMGEGDMLSDDGTLMVLCGDGKEVFTLNMATLDKGTVSILPGVESLYLTPRNNVLVSYHSIGSARFQGVELFDRNMRFVRQALPYNPHKDVMLDTEGHEILIHSNGGDPKPAIAAPSIVATRFGGAYVGGGVQRQLFKSDWALAEHISCPIGKDFFFVDRYDPTNQIQGDILKIWLDGKSEVLCLHGSMAFPPANKYTYQPKVSCNRDGTKLVYASNMGIGTPTNYSDVYMLKLAAEKPALVNPNLPIRFTWDKHRATIDKDGITIYPAAA